MSSIQPTPAAIEKLFLKPSLTPLIQSEAPNYTSIKLLQDELISNAVSVYSPLGDGDTGHLFLVVSEAEYVLATTSVTAPLGLPRPAPPTAPTSPIVVVPSTGTGTTTRSASSSTPVDNAVRQNSLLKKQAKKFLILRYAVQATIIYTSLDFSPNLATDGGCYNLIRPRLGLYSSSILP